VTAELGEGQGVRAQNRALKDRTCDQLSRSCS
jgi:hypothetical protein